MSDGLWFRLNGNFAEHPKVMGLSDRAFRLHVAGLCYATRNLTDGFVSDLAVKVACALTKANRRHVVELRDAGLWIVCGGGWAINDYLVYNPGSETMKELSSIRREVGRKGGLRSGETRRAKSTAEANKASASSKREASASSPEEAIASKHVTQRSKKTGAVVLPGTAPVFQHPEIKSMEAA